ncbi:MAG TPA: hypothetical protein VGJ33_06300 [Candidatus Angelobacter sp.]|jgi:hypothetical protein
MAEPKQNAAPDPRNPYWQLFSLIISIVVLSAVWFYLIGLLDYIELLRDSSIVKVLQYGIAGLFLALGTYGAFLQFFELRAAAQARQANQKVAEAFNQIKNRTPDKNVAEISTREVAASLKDAKIGDEQLGRLVEQRKQQLLIDDEYFREELSSLIVDYLQPLPRNTKRLLNRFRVNLLIAHSRGLLISEPKVTAQQIGKWLVLMERWPQLGRSLSAAPEKMKVLEEQAVHPAPTKSSPPQPDPFMESITALAPPYLGDEDLRKFIHSQPGVAVVVPRLVHYGAAELA